MLDCLKSITLKLVTGEWTSASDDLVRHISNKGREISPIVWYCGSARTELKMWCAIVVSRGLTTRVWGEQTGCTVCTVQNVWWKKSESGVKRAKWSSVRTEYVLQCHNIYIYYCKIIHECYQIFILELKMQK
jgi:hypothetical protein